MTKAEIAAAKAEAARRDAQAEAEKAAIQQAQEARKAAKQNEPVPGDQMVVLPGGRRVMASEFLDHRYAGLKRKELDFLGDPARFVKEPDPGYEYWLPDGDDVNTQAKISAKVYIPVLLEEMDPSKMAPTHVGTDNYVHWKRHILVKVRKDYAELEHKGPEMEAIQRLVTVTSALQDKAEKETRGEGQAFSEMGTRPETVRVR